MLQVEKQQQSKLTIDKTLLIAKLFDGFWDRWIAHGVDRVDLAQIRPHISTMEKWIDSWESLAIKKNTEAKKLMEVNKIPEALKKYQKAGLYFQLIQWLIPEDSDDKRKWLHESLTNFEKADHLSNVKTEYEALEIVGNLFFGRVRIPENPKGVVIIINPLDSSKEELFTYEMDFVNQGYKTISFDGPGQGQTYAWMGVKGRKDRWKNFIDELIDYSFSNDPELPIYLFGTSSGASWALYGSCNPKVEKVVAVSPAFMDDNITLPEYFVERAQFVLEEENILPQFHNLDFRSPVLLVHGKKDVMVSDKKIYELYNQLPEFSTLLEYEDEGHCCNYKLEDIRQKADSWFMEK